MFILHQCSEGKFHDDPQKYKIAPLAWFFVKILRSSLSDIEVYRSRYAQLQKLSESGLAVLNCFKSSPENRLKVSDIEKDTGAPRRTIQYALKTLTAKAFIQKLGQGTDCRLDTDESTGFALAHDKQVMHMSLFAKAAENNQQTPGSRMIRFSQRRRRRF